jgi:signal transduction histidine kinase/CheY-like chemotaxis protein
MSSDWSHLLSAASSIFLFALGTQVTLAWIFALLFFSFQRSTASPAYFRTWTRAAAVRAAGLSTILVHFALALTQGKPAGALHGSALSPVFFGLYQSAKFVGAWWMLMGAASFAGRDSLCRYIRKLTPLVAGLALASVAWLEDVEQLLQAQSPLVVVTSLASAALLLRVERAQRSAGTRLTAAALLLQAALWSVYFLIYFAAEHGPWPIESSPASILAANNSYFDLCVDVVLASGIVVLLLQDLHRRQVLAESERARLQAELSRVERLRTLGTLVSGVAHELNNPLTAILGFSEALETQSPDAECARLAGVVREQALRCRRIVRGLSTFSGQSGEVLERLEVRPLFERVVRGFEFELARSDVVVEIDVPRDAPRVPGDRFALEQMLTNLVANAIQASPRGGRVSLTACARPGTLELRVEDDGPGIPDGLRAHIFDPFFTTRAPGEGTGLGLAVAHGIVSAHGGSIRAEDGWPRGARLVVTLPAASASDAGSPLPVSHIPRPVRAPAASAAPAPLDLLVIEDESIVCEMIATLGARRGWRVRSATNGRAGLELLETQGPSFHVVLCDLRMAGLSGIAIHDRLAQSHPELLERFLFITGDLGSEEAASFARRCRRPILPKPFRLHDLVAEVERLASALDRSQVTAHSTRAR